LPGAVNFNALDSIGKNMNSTMLKTLSMASILALTAQVSRAQDTAENPILPDVPVISTDSQVVETPAPVETLPDAEIGPVFVADAGDKEKLMHKGIRFGNPFDSSTWWDAAEGTVDMKGTVAINFSDPDFWMQIVTPEKHGQFHVAVFNPRTWAQFVKVETYVAMMNPKLLAKWVDLDTYDALLDPQTYAYWMQPGAYAGQLRPAVYANLIDGAAYAEIATAAAETLRLSFVTNMNADTFRSIFN